MSFLDKELDWFHNNPLKHYEHKEMCQCGSENIISRSKESERMRAFLLVSIFFDQLIYTHFHQYYQNFKHRYQIPKLKHHTSGGHASPSWFINSKRGYDQSVDWDIVGKYANNIRLDICKLLESNAPGSSTPLDEIIEAEINKEFENDHRAKLINAFRVTRLNT
jgi:hypothetical protein